VGEGFRTLDDVRVAGKRVIVREDFNVPLQDGEVSDDTRLKVALPTIRRLREAGAKVVLISHFDRPKGKRVPSMSLKPLAEPLAKLIGAPVAFAHDCIGESADSAVAAMQPGDVLLLALHAALGSPKRPVLGVVGGSKVSTKLDLLHNLILKLDQLAIGGGMANTFLFAQGWDVGASYCEKDLADTARGVMAFAKSRKCQLLLPIDIVVAERPEPGAAARVRELGELDDHERILDAGPKTVARLCEAMDAAATLIWNGPLGVFEVPPFDKGTVTAARHAAALAKAGKLVAVAGGGDTVSALNAAHVAGDFTFVSTAGGAFLEWMEGKSLPGVEALKAAAEVRGK